MLNIILIYFYIKFDRIYFLIDFILVYYSFILTIDVLLFLKNIKKVIP